MQRTNRHYGLYTKKPHLSMIGRVLSCGFYHPSKTSIQVKSDNLIFKSSNHNYLWTKQLFTHLIPI